MTDRGRELRRAAPAASATVIVLAVIAALTVPFVFSNPTIGLFVAIPALILAVVRFSVLRTDASVRDHALVAGLALAFVGIPILGFVVGSLGGEV